MQNDETFHSFHEEEIGELLAKKVTLRTARRLNLTEDICYLENICSTESPKLAIKQATEDKLNIHGGKHILACF